MHNISLQLSMDRGGEEGKKSEGQRKGIKKIRQKVIEVERGF